LPVEVNVLGQELACLVPSSFAVDRSFGPFRGVPGHLSGGSDPGASIRRRLGTMRHGVLHPMLRHPWVRSSLAAPLSVILIVVIAMRIAGSSGCVSRGEWGVWVVPR
jgi:hypothetical protein